MKREEFIEDLITEIKSVPISEVFRLYDIELRRSGSSYICKSPFRQNASKTSFTLSDQMGIFKDWVMPDDYTGDSIKFVSLMENISYFEAIFELGLKLDLITIEEYEKYFKKRRYKKYYQENIEKKYNVSKEVKVESKRANIEDLDKVYRMFIDKCELSKNHKKMISENYGQDEEEMEKNMLFTFPTRYILRGFLKDIEEEYGSTEILSTIPGFYKRVGEDRYTFNRYKGIGIPIKDANDKIQGIQIRLDSNDTDLRYFWFSSSFAIDDPSKKTECGTGVGSPLGVIYPKQKDYDVLFITEGFFKAVKIAEQFNAVAITVQGVGNWRGIKEEIKNIEKRLNTKFIYVYIAYDSDLRYNFGVYNQAKKLGDYLDLPNDKIAYVLWNEDYGKGIDDMINAGKVKTISKIQKDKYDNIMTKFEKNILKKYQVDSVLQTDLSKEDLKDLYYKQVNI